MGQSNKKDQDEFKTAVTMTVVWVAGLTLILIFVALFVGIMLDKVLNSRPMFTIILTIASIPVTIYATFRVVRAATRRIQPAIKKDITEEVPHRAEES
jgi:F0F1-type ATP synthase assembly protein I